MTRGNEAMKQKAKTGNSLYYKISKSGGTRYLAMGKILPEDWLIVKVSIEKLEDTVCFLRIEKLA